MYAEFFGLRELPFNNTPDPRFFHPTPDHEEALASLTYTVRERKGFVLLTGEVGTGKTLIARLMLRQFGARIAYAYINHAVTGAPDLLEAIAAELEIPVEPGGTMARLVRRLHDFLLARFAQDMPVVLVLDEAQNLPDDAFEQIRTIGNLEADDAKLLQIVIVGQPELQERFASPNLRQLRQRIFRSFHLSALNRAATEAYIRFRLNVAGGKGDIFDRDALDRIHECTQGLPRLINTLCDNALLSAYSADRRTIDGRFLQGVVDQLMLRVPPPRPAQNTTTGDAPEFGRATSSRVPSAEGAGKTTFEKLSRLVDVLEHRMTGARQNGEAAPPHAPAPQDAEAAVRSACAAAEHILREAADRERMSRQVTEQLKTVVEHVRISFDGVHRLCAEAVTLKEELTGLYERFARGMDEIRSLLIRVETMPFVSRDAAIPPPAHPAANATPLETRTRSLRDISHGIAQLQSLLTRRASGHVTCDRPELGARLGTK